MKRALILSLVVVGVFALIQCTDSKAPSVHEAASAQPTHQDTVQRGEYLVNAIGCDDCHSPKRMGAQGPEIIPELRLSGYPGDRPFDNMALQSLTGGWYLLNVDLTCAVGPWGASFSANLTSDETGVGNWTFDQFKKALKEGKYKGLDSGRTLLPPMPWQYYGKLNDDDLAAIFVYLKSITPVRNVPPPPIPPDQLKK
ncbi:MAG TPA: hypothetical protein VI603_06065 [Saprospiraceae bacterium]|nr:hypothetical protein [Saprospiraceae bacterium]